MEGKQQNNSSFQEVRRTLIGLAVAFAIVGLVGVAVFYLFPTFILSPRADWTVVEENSFSIYYKKEALSGSVPKTYLSRAIHTKKEFIDGLELDEGDLPESIRVYLHKDLTALKSSIAERKSSTSVDDPLAVMDLISGYEIEPLLVRLLTTFSWGRPSSEFLRLGLQSFFSDELDRPHLRVTGLEENRLSFQDIISLEKTDNITRSLLDKIYDSFDSPNAPAGMSLSGLSSLMRSVTGETPYRYELEAESVSFVTYLINEYGPVTFRNLWEADSFREGVDRVFGATLEELERDWLQFVESRSKGGYYDRFYRARTLFSKGKLSEAMRLLRDYPEEDLTEEYLFLKVKVHFYRGEWRKAREYLSDLEDQGISADMGADVKDYKKLINAYESGERKEAGKLIVFAVESVQGLTDLVSDCSYVVERAKSQLPDLIDKLNLVRVFVTTRPENTETWVRLDHPEDVAFGSLSEALPLKVSQIVVNEMSRTPTYSNLLRRGLIHYLVDSDVLKSARKIVMRERWESLGGLIVGLDPESSSSTQAGAFVGYLLSQYGPEKFTRVWHLTTPLGGDNSLETALNKVVGKGLGQIEDEVKRFLEAYPE